MIHLNLLNLGVYEQRFFILQELRRMLQMERDALEVKEKEVGFSIYLTLFFTEIIIQHLLI